MSEYRVVVPIDAPEFNESYRNVVGSAGYLAANNLFSRLVVTEVGSAGSYPDLADHWECLDGARRWRFHITRAARWHDGERVTAHDVAYTHQHAIEHDYHAASFLESVGDVEAIDEEWVEYRLPQPNSALLTQLGNFVATHIVPKHLYDGTDWATNPHNHRPIGSGPMRFVEHIPGERIVLEAWPDYWGPPAGVERIVMLVQPDLDECVRMVADGRAHYSPQDVLTKKRLPLMEGSTHAETYRERGPGVAMFGFNYDRPQWNDVRVRRALAHALDRSRLGRFAEDGWSEPFDHFLPRASFAFCEDARAVGHDVEEAERLLDEAGYPRAADGVRMRVDLIYMSSFDGHSGLAASVVDDLAAVGVVATVAAIDSQDWGPRIVSGRDFDVSIVGGNMMPDPDITASRYSTGGKRNHMNLSNPAADACYAAARGTTTRSERIEHYHRLQHIWARDVSIIPLFWYCIYLPRSTRFFGWSDQLDFRVPFWHWGRIRPIDGTD